MAFVSHAYILGDSFIQTEQSSKNIFSLVNGNPTPETNIAKPEHIFRNPARTVNMVPVLANQSLLSGDKFAEAGYVSVCDVEEVKFYNRCTTIIIMSEDAVLKGWRCPRTKLYRIPLRYHVTDLNIHTLFLNGPTGREFINSLYSVPTCASVLDHIEQFNTNHAAGETINNVYDLPSLACAVRYLHAAAGLPTKATWIKSICKVNYLTWLLITVKNLNRHFP